MNCLICANDIRNVFYTTVDSQGNVDTLCYKCYSISVLDNYPEMKDNGGTKVLSICECGKDKHGFASHSSWCKKA